MLETISLIVSVASGLLASVQSIKDMRGVKRATASIFLSKIAFTIDEVVEKFKKGEVPHGACEQMKMFALNLPSTLDGILPIEQLIDYSNKLYYAHEIEMLYKDVMSDESKLEELEKVAGMFHAAAELVKL